MNNCPKCGNPLQPGTVSCPICGTNLKQATETPAANQNINTVASKPATETKAQSNQTTQATQPQASDSSKTIAPKPIAQASSAPISPAAQKTVEQPKPTGAASTSQSVQPSVAPKTVNQSQAVPTQTQVAQSTTIAPTSEAKPAPVQSSQLASASTQVATPIVEQSQDKTSAPVVPTQEVSATPVVPSQPVGNPAPTQVSTVDASATLAETIQPVAPTIAQTDQGLPVPSIPTSLNNSNNASLNASTLKVESSKEEKKGLKISKKNLIIIAVAALVVVVGAVLSLNIGKKPSMKPTNNDNTNQDNKISAISYTAGYKFNLPAEWSIIEDGTNVILKNSDETLTLKLENIKDSLENSNEEKIKKYLESLTSTDNIEIISTQISGKDAYLVNVTMNNYPVQIYLINSGTRLITGATIIYQNEDIKASSDATITELLGTLSYSDESVKAIGTLNMYSNIFNIYKGIINYQEPTIPDNSFENNNDINNGNNLDMPVQGETESSNENNVEPTPVQPEQGNN